MEQLVLVPYSKEEQFAFQQELTGLMSEYLKIDADKTRTTGAFNIRLNEIWEKIKELEPRVRLGGDRQMVDVERKLFPEINLCRVYRKDTGDLIEEREMTDEEREACREWVFGKAGRAELPDQKRPPAAECG